MLKIQSIKILDSRTILCVFNTGETRIFDIKRSLDSNNKLAKKLANQDTFKNAKIGEFGEIYWEGIGEIKEIDGSISSCVYDISPEFVFYNSSKLDDKKRLEHS
jgi:hypothetical protein